MQEDVKNWIIQHYFSPQSLSGEEKTDFLMHLRDKKEVVIGWLSHQLYDWETVACLKLNTAVYSFSLADDAAELADALEKHYAKEIAALPATAAAA